jgi:hypothetical protein
VAQRGGLPPSGVRELEQQMQQAGLPHDAASANAFRQRQS